MRGVRRADRGAGILHQESRAGLVCCLAGVSLCAANRSDATERGPPCKQALRLLLTPFLWNRRGSPPFVPPPSLLPRPDGRGSLRECGLASPLRPSMQAEFRQTLWPMARRRGQTKGPGVKPRTGGRRRPCRLPSVGFHWTDGNVAEVRFDDRGRLNATGPPPWGWCCVMMPFRKNPPPTHLHGRDDATPPNRADSMRPPGLTK